MKSTSRLAIKSRRPVLEQQKLGKAVPKATKNFIARLAEERTTLKGGDLRAESLLELALAQKIKREAVEIKIGRKKVRIVISKPASSNISQRTLRIRLKNLHTLLKVLEKKNLFLSKKMAYAVGKTMAGNTGFSLHLDYYTFAKVAGDNLGYFAEGAGEALWYFAWSGGRKLRYFAEGAGINGLKSFAKGAGAYLLTFGLGASASSPNGLNAIRKGIGAKKYNEWVNYIKKIYGDKTADFFKI